MGRVLPDPSLRGRGAALPGPPVRGGGGRAGGRRKSRAPPGVRGLGPPVPFRSPSFPSQSGGRHGEPPPLPGPHRHGPERECGSSLRRSQQVGGPPVGWGGCLLSRGWGEPRSSAESRLPDKDPGGVGRVLLIKLGIISYAQGLSFSSGLSLVTTGGLPPILPP